MNVYFFRRGRPPDVPFSDDAARAVGDADHYGFGCGRRAETSRDNIWQRSFHEHVICSEHDYREKGNYIDGNPAKWAEDRYDEP